MNDFKKINKLVQKNSAVDSNDIKKIFDYTEAYKQKDPIGIIGEVYDVTVNVNENNYRSDSFDGDGIMYLGCSLTEGFALEEYDTWPWIVSKHFDKKVWNLARSGEGMDKMFITSLFWIPKLKPKVVCLLVPSAGRYFTGYEWHEKFGSNSFYSYYDMNSAGHNKQFEYLWDNKYMYTHDLKNLLSIAFICKVHNIEFIYKSHDDFENFTTSIRAKDNNHPGLPYQQEVADSFCKEIE